MVTRNVPGGFLPPPTYPLGMLVMKSRRGPSRAKETTRNQLACRLSLGPELLATEYLMISPPLLVGCSSGVSARLPMMLMRAMPRGDDVLKARRALLGAAAARRIRNEDISGLWTGERKYQKWIEGIALLGVAAAVGTDSTDSTGR